MPHVGRSLILTSLLLAAAVSIQADVSVKTCAAKPATTDIAYGDLVNCEIKPVGDSNLYRFTGQAGDRVDIFVLRYGGNANQCFRIVQPDGTVGAYNCVGQNSFGARFASLGFSVTLSASGPHTIQVVDGGSDETFSYGIELVRLLPLPASTTPLSRFGLVVSGEITPRGDQDFYTFSGASGDTVPITVTRLSGNANQCFRIIQPDGTIGDPICVGQNSFGARFAAVSADIKLVKPGVHAVEIWDGDYDESYPYNLQVQCLGVCPSQSSVKLSLNTSLILTLARAASQPAPASDTPAAGGETRAPIGPVPVTPGTNLTLTHTLTNSATGDATQTAVVTTLPAGIQLVSCTVSTGGSCTANGGTVTASTGTLSSGASAVVTVQARVAPTATAGSTLTVSTQGAALENNASPESSTSSVSLSVVAAGTAAFRFSGLVVPPAGGLLTANPSSSDGFYLPGTQIALTATPAPGWAFANFSGDLSGSANFQTLTLSRDAMRVTASFTTSTSAAMRFVPVTPCRVVDTRSAPAPLGGSTLIGGSTRNFAIPGTCNVPASALAYAFNVTVVPRVLLGYLSIWPAGQPQPFVSTLNSTDGRIKANAAIVPAGASGAVSVYATDSTELVLDINGYFVSAAAAGSLAFFPVSPCRVSDTRLAAGPLGGPRLDAGQPRTIPVLTSTCGIPPSARAYSLNITAVPYAPLGYLTAWPAGESQPLVSTLNSPTVAIVANAAIVPAGTSGGISVYVTNPSELVIDINGYFAAPASGGMSFFALNPCRVSDTRLAQGPLGGPAMVPLQSRDFPIQSGACGVPASAKAYSLNATVVPTAGYLAYLTLWPTGLSIPFVSTLNALDGSITANAALVPAGTQGSVAAQATGATELILDINGYFAP